jgi:hypothetical protein
MAMEGLMLRQALVIGFCALALSACGGGEEAAAPAADTATTDTAAEAAAPAADQGEGVPTVAFKIENGTERTLTHLYISPADAETWNRDILGDQTAPAGATIDVSIDDGVESCMYDMRAQFGDAGNLDVRGVNVCEIEGRTITISENG